MLPAGHLSMLLSSRSRVSGARGACVHGTYCNVMESVSTNRSIIAHAGHVQNRHRPRRTEKATQQSIDLDLYLTRGDTKLHFRGQEFQFHIASITEWSGAILKVI